MDCQLIKKIIECTFVKSKIKKITYILPERLKNMTREKEINRSNQLQFETWKIKNTEGNSYILKPLEGISYSDVVSNMKKDVNIEGIMIDRINKTANGNVQSKVKGRDAFRETLTTKVKEYAVVNNKQKGHTAMILDIDDTVDTNQIRETLPRELNSDKPVDISIRLSETTNRNGLKYAFITGTEEKIRQLCNRRFIGEGWNRWKMKEIISPPKCFKCFRVGHTINKCPKKEREDLCHNCGEAGHLKKDCKNNQKCYLCNSSNHLAESMRCPEYRKLVRQHKEKQRWKNTQNV